MKPTLLTLLLMLASWSQSPSREESALLEGVVVAQGTGAPIARARAMLSRAGNFDPKDALPATTDVDGKFAIKDIPPGVYQLFIGHASFVAAEYGQRSPSKDGLPITLTAGQATRVSVELTPVASIYGKIANPQGPPISNFLVKAFRVHYEQGERVFSGGSYAVSEDNGEFRLFGLAPGWYFLSVVPSEEYGPLPLLAGSLNWPTYYGGPTEDESKPIHLTPGGAFDAGTLVIQRGPATRVRGQIVDAVTGKPDPNARILLGRKRRIGIETSGLSAPALKSGYFELAGAAPGTYVIDAVTPSSAGSVSFEARGADVDDLRVLLYPRVNVSGRASLEGASAAASTAAFLNMRVILDTGRTAIEAAIDARGAFTLANVPVGDYRVTVSGTPPHTFLRSARLGAFDVLDSPLRVSAKLTATLDLALESVSGVFAAIALDARRRPVPAAVVVLAPKDRHRLDLFRKALTDDSGNARFEDVPPGDYRVFAWEEIEENAWQDPDILRAYEDRGESITVRHTGVVIATVNVIPFWLE